MPPRAMWTGQLRLSLVTFGVRMYAATESTRRVAMNQLHEGCNQRVRQQLTCPVHGTIGRDEIVKGYEYEKGSYVIITEEDLETIRLESTKAIELVQFVDANEIDPIYFNAPYFLGPDGPVAEEPFNVIREAMGKAGKIGLGKVVMHGREQVVALKVDGRGFQLTTLRYPSEVRQGEQFFKDVRLIEPEAEMMQLAESIIDKKTSKFDPDAFEDKYKEAFFELVKQKVDGETPVTVEDEEPAQSFNFMDALRQSVEQSAAPAPPPAAKKPAGRSASAKGAKKASSKTASKKKPAAKSVSGSKKAPKDAKKKRGA